jgi:hypothetical protein
MAHDDGKGKEGGSPSKLFERKVSALVSDITDMFPRMEMRKSRASPAKVRVTLAEQYPSIKMKSSSANKSRLSTATVQHFSVPEEGLERQNTLQGSSKRDSVGHSAGHFILQEGSFNEDDTVDISTKVMQSDPDRGVINITAFPFVVLTPESAVVQWWEIVTFVFVVAVGYMAPLELAFRGALPSWWPPAHWQLDLCFSIFFCLDFFTKFVISFRDHSGQLEFEPVRLARHYVATFSFWIDLLSAIPFQIIGRQNSVLQLFRLVPIGAYAHHVARSLLGFALTCHILASYRLYCLTGCAQLNFESKRQPSKCLD